MTARFPPNPQIERGFAQLFPSSPLQSPPGGRELGRMAALASSPLTTAALEPPAGPLVAWARRGTRPSGQSQRGMGGERLA